MTDQRDGTAVINGDYTASRQWLDWREPLLRQAATWLLDRASRSHGLVALDRVACITPGRRAGRVLTEELVRQCQAREERLLPPATLTPGAMIDVLTVRSDGHDDEATLAPASAIECELAWMSALERQEAGVLNQLLANIPERSDRPAWQAIARLLHRLYVELTGQRRSFQAVREAVEQMDLVGEAERWGALERIHRDYHAVLRGCGLEDAERCRERAAAEADLSPAIDEIVLIGVTELNQVQRTLLNRAIDRVTALVHAPAAHADGFDALGCVKATYWCAQPLDLDEACIVVADQAGDQAQAAVRAVAAWSDRWAADEMTIGVEDAALTDQLELAAKWAHVHVHRADGRAIATSPPYRLFEAIADWLDEPRFAHFAAMLRHPDLDQFLYDKLRHQSQEEIDRSVGDWLTLLDRYFEEHLHERLTGDWLGRSAERERLGAIYDAVSTLLLPLRDHDERPLAAWAGAILEVLAAVYEPVGKVDSPADQQAALDVCAAIRDALSHVCDVAEPLQPKVRAGEAVRMTLDLVRAQTLPGPVRDDQIEVLGWLELHADLAPALILMGVNDGVIPTSLTGDAFLPDSVRRALGLTDNTHRYARDSYLLQAIRHSREELVVMTGRRSDEGDPLVPSRLLLACDRDRLPGRVRRLFDETRANRWPIPVGMKQARTSGFQVPRPPTEPPVIDHMSVTSFARYLACPYRFWLERVLRLQAVEDSGMELDSGHFGTFLHEILQSCGEDASMCDSTDAREIRAILLDTLQTHARQTFGTSPMPAVRIQIDRMARRLEGFAQRQAALRRQGWRIVQCEHRLPEHVTLDIPDQAPMRISGIIDRIDQHENTDAFRIIDYKTGNNVKTPAEAHHPAKTRRDEWVDLQLPLYRHLAEQIDIAGEVEVGYFVLPRDPEKCDLLLADWSTDELSVAIDTARDVVRRVRAGEFWPPETVDARFDSYANICQTNAFGRDDFSETPGGDE